jgi:hypothetical protein
MVNLPGALMMLAVALIIGFLASWPAGRRGDNRVGVAVSGAAGPVLVAAAYFLAAPVSGDNQHMSAFVIAPYAVLAGLAGSVLVSAIGPKGYRTQVRAQRRADSAERAARDAAQFTDWTHALAEAERRSDRAEQEPPAPEPVPGEHETGTEKRPVANDIEEDAYAPARAYTPTTSTSRAYAEDTVEPEPPAAGTATGTATATATGRAAVKEPLWPEETTEPADKPKRKFRGGGKTDS